MEARAPTVRPARRSALVWIGIGVTLAFTYLAVRDAHLGDMWEALRESEKLWVAPAFAVLCAAVVVRAARWRVLFEGPTRPPLPEVLRALLIGYFFNNVLPLRAGEAARIVALNRRTRLSFAQTTATVVVERAYDVLALLLLLFAIAYWLPDVTWLQTAAFVLVGLGAVLVAAALVLARFGTRALRIVLYPLSWLPFLSATRFEFAVRNLVQGFVGLHSVRIAAEALVMTVVSWILIAVSFWLVLLGFDLGLSPLAGLLVVIAVNLSLVLPSSPAALGVFEWATVVALGAYGVTDSEALSYAVVVHALNFVPFVVAGIVLLHREALPLRR